MSTFPSGDFAIGDTHGQRQRIDPIAEPRHRLTPARPRREVIGPFEFCTDPIDSYEPGPVTLVGPNETARRYADQQAEEMASHGYFQAKQLDVARIAEDRSSLARLTALIADASRDTGGDPGGMARWLIAQGVRL